MERKTIGRFIAVLRKANGMTQRELAEKLNVSDKAVSRWERDESYPDLSLIPVLAEIFQVTADELLRGERIQKEEVGSTDVKTEKQRNHILEDTVTRYKIRSVFSIGIAMIGFLIAMICNFGWNRAYIGFFGAAIFFVIAVLFETASWISFYVKVSGEEQTGEKVEHCKRTLFHLTEKSVMFIFVLFAAALPLILFPDDAFQGLAGSAWLRYGLLLGMAAFGICLLLLRPIYIFAVKKRVYLLSEAQDTVFHRENRVYKKTVLLCMIALGVTLLLQILFNNIFSFTSLPITTYTYQDEVRGTEIRNGINMVWLILYLVEMLISAVFYYFRRHTKE